MSMLILTFPDSADAHSILTCAKGAEFESLISFLTNKNIHYVPSQEQADKQGTYCTPINYSANQFLYYQALDDGASGVYYATVGYLVFVNLLDPPVLNPPTEKNPAEKLI